jgi:hypothetical protein
MTLMWKALSQVFTYGRSTCPSLALRPASTSVVIRQMN